MDTLERREHVFAVSYAVAYCCSIFWQHLLNRWLLSSLAAAPYCNSLLWHYVTYSFSLAAVTLCGATLIRFGGMEPRVATLLMQIGRAHV